MACKHDLRRAVYDKVAEEAIENRYTFTRISDDTVRINSKYDNSKSKAQNAAQAKAIANNLIKSTYASFEGQVTGYVNQASPYDPVTVTFRATDAYINWLYSKLPSTQQTDTNFSPSEEGSDNSVEQERAYELHDTDVNTEGIVNFNADINNNDVTRGVFAKYLKFKNTQVRELEKRLSEIKRQKKIKGITTERLTQLKKLQKEIETTLEGNFEQGKKGIKDEIKELERNAETKAVQYYAEKDLQRLKYLEQSNDLDDLNEAQRIIDFWTSAGTFEWTGSDPKKAVNKNPFFTQADIFLIDENDELVPHYKLSEEVRNTYSGWALKAKESQITIDYKRNQLMVDAVNSDYIVKATYGGKEFTLEELIHSERGLRDVDWISMWTMDVTQGIFSHNGVLPQVMFSYLTNSFEKKLAWARSVEERIDELNPKVQKELMDSKYKGKYTLRGLGILGLKGASYNLFKEISKEGNETGGIVQRFSREYFDEDSKSNNEFNAAKDEAKLIADKTVQRRAFNKAFEERKRWRRNNSIIIDITQMPEITSDTEFDELTEGKQPADTKHKDELIKILGQKGYDEAVEKQKELLRKYLSEKKSILDVALHQEGKTTFDELSTDTKNELKQWSNNHSPLKGYEDYYSTVGITFGEWKSNNFMDYNHFIPRQFKPTITANATTKQYEFADTTEATHSYSENYKIIEDNPILSEFYDVVREVTETIKENMSPELQQKMGSILSLPGLEKTSAEIIADKNTGTLNALFQSFKHMWENLRTSFGVHKQNDVSYADPLNPESGKPNYKVNDGFLQGNSRAVADRMVIEKTKFLQAYNKSRPANSKMTKIKRFSTIPLSGLNQDTINLLAGYLHVKPDINEIRKITGEQVEIGKYIRDFSIHSVVQSQSFDLGKLTKYFSNMTMVYAARQEALPILEIMKKHYDSIKQPHTNNIDNQIRNIPNEREMQIGFRTGAIKQMDDWFERVVLDNYGLKHKGVHGRENIESVNAEGEIETKVSKFGKTIYTKEERKRLNEINKLLSKGVSEEEGKKLTSIKEGLGKTRTTTAAIDNLLAWIRTLRLGYNLNSMTTNFLEGMTANLIIGSSDQYFDPNELFYGYGVIKGSFAKNVTFGHLQTRSAKKNRKLMDKFNVIMDSKNELQKSSIRTPASRLEWLNPHAGNQRVEFINQSPIMIAMLRTMKVKGIDGTESKIWDAYDEEGKLKPNFRTEENIENWENLTGEQYLAFKQKLNKVIVLAHGNYDQLRGMMAKSTSAGKAFMMFKTWLPNAIYQRFAVEQDDIQTSTKDFKGKYRSYTPTTAGLHVGLVGTSLFGPLGIALGVGVGVGMSIARVGVQQDIGVLTQSIEVAKMLAKKMIGMPVNIAAGRKIVGIGTEGFNDWVGKGDFTQMDADNLKSNMTDIAIQLGWLAMILIAKGLFWDDEDDPESAERIAHNLIVNKAMQLSSQAAMYINPIDKNNVVSSTLGNIAVFKYLEDAGKFTVAVSRWANGESDTIPTGVNAGESRMLNTASKLILPGIFKDVFGDRMLGFGDQAERVFTESVWHKRFKSDESLDKAENKGDRAAMRAELEQDLPLDQFDGETREEQEKNRKKYIDQKLDETLPTPAKLKKMGLTREEFEEQLKQKEQ